MTRRTAFWGAIVATVVVVVALVVAEVVLRGWFADHMKDAPVPCGDWDEDFTRLKFAYALEAGRRPEMPSHHYAWDARRGYALAPDVRGLDMYGGVANSNSMGARGLREYTAEKPPETTRIVALGDSFTFGEGVDDEDTWPAQLESMLPNTEVINFGASAYAHDQMYFALIDVALPLDPDIVVLGFYPDDMNRNRFSFYCYEKPRFARRGDGWEIENVPVPRPREVHDAHIDDLLVWALTRSVLLRDLFAPEETDPEAVTTHILDEMLARTKEAGVRFVLLFLPGWHDTDPSYDGCDFFCQYCQSRDVECVDPRPVYFARRRELGDERTKEAWFLEEGGGHPTARGYRIAAEALRDHLAMPASRPNP